MLSLYPSEYLRRHRAEMLATFEDVETESRSAVAFWWWIGKDYLASLVWQHLRTRSAKVAFLGALTFIPFFVLVAAQMSIARLGHNLFFGIPGWVVLHTGIAGLIFVFFLPAFGMAVILAGVGRDLRRQHAFGSLRPSLLRDHVVGLALFAAGVGIVQFMPWNDATSCLGRWASGEQFLTRRPSMLRINDVGTFLEDAAHYKLRDLGCARLPLFNLGDAHWRKWAVPHP
jgi:hypothetical protein